MFCHGLTHITVTQMSAHSLTGQPVKEGPACVPGLTALQWNTF